MFQDKTLVCKDCGAEFVFTARKSQRSGEREMYDAVCAACGAPTKIPFVPKNDRPIYCSACFQARKGR